MHMHKTKVNWKKHLESHQISHNFSPDESISVLSELRGPVPQPTPFSAFELVFLVAGNKMSKNQRSSIPEEASVFPVS